MIFKWAASELEVELRATRTVVQFGHGVGTLCLVICALKQVVSERVAAADGTELLRNLLAADLLGFCKTQNKPFLYTAYICLGQLYQWNPQAACCDVRTWPWPARNTFQHRVQTHFTFNWQLSPCFRPRGMRCSFCHSNEPIFRTRRVKNRTFCWNKAPLWVNNNDCAHGYLLKKKGRKNNGSLKKQVHKYSEGTALFLLSATLLMITRAAAIPTHGPLLLY